MAKLDKQDQRIANLFGTQDVPEVDTKTLERYRAYLQQHLALPCQLTGIEDFDWEEYYVIGPGSKAEHERLQLTASSVRLRSRFRQQQRCSVSRMLRLSDTFPTLAQELVKSLRATGRAGLAEQIEAAVIGRVSFDNAANAGYIYLEPSRNLNVVEANIVGTRHGETIPVETQFWTTIDTDNFDRILGIEILDPGSLKAELRRRASG
jgi:hypothetical protein